MTRDPLPEMRVRLVQAARAGIACGYSRCAAKLDLEVNAVLEEANTIVNQMEVAAEKTIFVNASPADELRPNDRHGQVPITQKHVDALQLRATTAEKALSDLENALVTREMTYCVRGGDLYDLGFVKQEDRNKERWRAEKAEELLMRLRDTSLALTNAMAAFYAPGTADREEAGLGVAMDSAAERLRDVLVDLPADLTNLNPRPSKVPT